MLNSEIRLTEGLQQVRLNEGMHVLSDPDGMLTYAQAQEFRTEERFAPASGRSSFGLDGKTYWIQTTITNESTLDRWVLRLSNAIVDSVDLYADGQQLNTTENSDNGKKLDDHYWSYELVLPANHPVTLYLRVTTMGAMILPLDLMNASVYYDKLRAEFILFGLYYGFVMLMAAYIFMMYIFMKNVAYFYYLLYIIFFALSQLVWNGLPQELLGEQSELIRFLLRILGSYEDIFLFFFILCLWFVLFFLDRVLQIKVYAPKLRYAATAIKWASPFVVLALLFHLPGFSTIAIWYEFIVFMVLIASIFYSVFRGNIAARYIVLGVISIFGLAIPAVLYTFGLVQHSLLTHYGYQLGSITEFIIFAAALSYQTRQNERGKINAQRQMIVNQEKLVRTLEQWNEELEHTVSERTEKLVHSQRRRSELLQNISHDIRSPLTVVQGGIKAMMLGIQVRPGEQNKHLEDLYGKVLYITRFIDDLFQLSIDEQDDSNSHHQSKETLHMQQWVMKEFAFLEEFIRIAGLQCETEIQADSDPVMTVDPHGMRRVLTNLVHNACKYSLANKRIRLEAIIDSDGVQISVEDEGQGIAAEHLVNIFERANRGAQHDPLTGSGLGLAIAKEIVEQHGGTITAESLPGRGSTFVVHLPAANNSYVPADGGISS
ncbi:ATP-binding protein [Paenibacillus sp. GCM10012307]